MEMRIVDLVPLVSSAESKEWQKEIAKTFKAIARPDTQIEFAMLNKGPFCIESESDEAYAAPGILENVKKLEAEGYDAIIIDCSTDPCVKAAREIAKIPVVGPGLAMMLFASAIGDQFSIVTLQRNVASIFRRRVKEYGLWNRLASVRNIGMPPFACISPLGKKRFVEEAKKAIENDGADVIVPGATCFVGFGKEFTEAVGAPVIEPAVSLKLAEALVDVGLSQSKVAYPNSNRLDMSI
jgi:allantoin racemase